VEGGRVAAVEAFLRDKRGTTQEIMTATGYSASSVKVALRTLRDCGDPCVQNLLLERDSSWRQAKLVRSDASGELPEETKTRVQQAIASRTPLELAWAA
jgi:hypothetical protein